MLRRPAPEGRGAAGLVHEDDEDAQDHQEDQDAHVVGVGEGRGDAVVEDVGQGALKAEVGVEQAAHYDAHEEGGVDLLGDEGKADGDDGREQGPEGLIEAGGGLGVRLALGEGEGGGDQEQQDQEG